MVEDHQGICDEGLIASTREDPVAFSKLYRRHYDTVFRHCMHRLFDRSAAEDVTSAVFLKVVRNLRRFRGDEAMFRNWLLRIATNAINDYLRDLRRRKNLLERKAQMIAGDEPTRTNDETDMLKALARAVHSLKPKHQAVIAMRFFDNMKVTDIAAVVGGSAATVRSRLSRALAALRKEMTGATTTSAREV